MHARIGRHRAGDGLFLVAQEATGELGDAALDTPDERTALKDEEGCEHDGGDAERPQGPSREGRGGLAFHLHQ